MDWGAEGAEGECAGGGVVEAAEETCTGSVSSEPVVECVHLV